MTKRLLVLFVCCLGAYLASTVLDHVRAQYLVSPYLIKYKHIYRAGKVAPEALASLPPEKRQLLTTGVVNEDIVGRKGNGDIITKVTADNQVTYVLSYPRKGIWIIANNRNNNISTRGTGEPELIYPETPACLAYIPSNYPSDRTDIILGFKAVHVKYTTSVSTIERWIAPDLACKDLRTIHTRLSDGAMDDTEVVEASTNSPDDELFDVIHNPVEMKPSDYWLALAPSRAGHKASDFGTAFGQDDILYTAEKAKRDHPQP